MRFPKTITHMKKALLALLKEFKWYRKKKGGKWYLIVSSSDKTLDGRASYWTQTAPLESAKIRKTESH